MHFLSWLSHRAKDLNLTLTRVRGVSRFVPQFNDFQAEIRLQGRTFVGRGRGWSEEEAASKACGEAIERAVFGLSEGLGDNTNGWALGLNRVDAERHAVAELIERDAFLCHYYTGTPFLVNRGLKESYFEPYLDHVYREGIELVLGRMRTVNGMHGASVAAFGENADKPFGVVIGLGCGETFEVACNKAYIECLTQLSAVLDGRVEGLNLSSFYSLSQVTPEDHGRLALSLENLPFVRSLYNLTCGESVERGQVRIQVADIELPRELSGAPVFVCRASSPNVQRLGFGSMKFINDAVLRDFCGGAVTHVNDFPHPLA